MSFTFSNSELVFHATMVSNQLNQPIDGTKEYLTIGCLDCFFFASHVFSTRTMMERLKSTIMV